MTYKVGLGHDIDLVDLDDLVPQPHSPGIKPTRRTYGADGTPFDEGLYVELIWNALGSAALYQSILTQLGLNLLKSSSVTVYVRTDTWTWVRCNGLAIRPELGRGAEWEMPFPRNITVLVRNLELLEEP